MRILAMTSGDFRTADSGMRLRDYYLCSALARLGDLDILTFVPHQATAGRHRDIDARVFLDNKPGRGPTLLGALLRGELYHGRLFDPRHHHDFRACAEETYDLIYCSLWYSVPAAKELRRGASSGALLIWDTHNYDPDVWPAMVATGRGLRRWFARREAKLALEAATSAARTVDAIIATTDEDAEKLRLLAPTDAVHVVPNGGEIARWLEAARHTSPEPRSCVVFGGMHQDSTRRGAEWFLDEVWPRVRAVESQSRLTIAGRGPARSLEGKISRAPGVRLVRNPDDMAAVVSEAEVIAVPQIWGTGSKIKMFEAVATGRRVVASPAAVVGMPPRLLDFVRIEEKPESWAEAILSSFGRSPSNDGGEKARHALIGEFDWSKSGDRLEKLVDDLLANRR